jgi:hypothetical protein
VVLVNTTSEMVQRKRGQRGGRIPLALWLVLAILGADILWIDGANHQRKDRYRLTPGDAVMVAATRKPSPFASDRPDGIQPVRLPVQNRAGDTILISDRERSWELLEEGRGTFAQLNWAGASR